MEHGQYRLVRILITFRLREPSQERLCGLADLLTGGQIDVFLASLGAPVGDDVLGEDIFVVEDQEDLGGLIVEGGVFLTTGTDKTFNATKEGLLVLLGCDQLENVVRVWMRDSDSDVLTFLSMEARLGICLTMLSSKIVWMRTMMVRCLVSMPSSLALR